MSSSEIAAPIALSVREVHERLARQKGVLLDVREPDEFRYERVPGSVNIPLARLAEAKGRWSGEEDLFVFCQFGARSEQALAPLLVAGYTNARSVAGGLEEWKRAGFLTEKKGGPLPILRQVQIATGSLVLIGSLVPHGRPLAVFIGAGLVFAGASGWCGLAILLRKLPWNRSAG